MILVTGGAGFIGSNFILDWLADRDGSFVNVDKLTYSGNMDNLASLGGDRRHIFVKGDICDQSLVEGLLNAHRPRAIINFAAESHVDRSIHGPAEFIRTNVMGTFALLEAARAYWSALPEAEQKAFRFLHVSTDEVYGSLEADDPAFKETVPYQPNSPYSASKAGSDHLVRAWHHTYGLPTLTTNCSNNYGPFQFPEKLIPLIIGNALIMKPIPIYGDGLQIRDWLYVGDHCDAIRKILDNGRPGQTYNIGGNQECTNIEIARKICAILDERRPRTDGLSYTDLISHVKDRLGHDRRYAIDPSKILEELDWRPRQTLEIGLQKTVDWYLDHPDWVTRVQSGEYQHWIKKQYGGAAAE